MSSPTKLTMLLIEAETFVKEKRYDLAEARAAEMETLRKGFGGALFVRFKIADAKGYVDHAIQLGRELIAKLPEEKRLIPVYLAVVNHLLKQGHKSEAEELALRGVKLSPSDPELRSSFEKIFGYQPARPTPEMTPTPPSSP